MTAYVLAPNGNQDTTNYYTYSIVAIVSHELHKMTSSNRNIIRVADPLCDEFTGHRGIPRTKASDAELWCFLWSAPEYTVK